MSKCETHSLNKVKDVLQLLRVPQISPISAKHKLSLWIFLSIEDGLTEIGSENNNIAFTFLLSTF